MLELVVKVNHTIAKVLAAALLVSSGYIAHSFQHKFAAQFWVFVALVALAASCVVLLLKLTLGLSHLLS